MATEIKLPELGENIEEAQVITVLVSPGDRIEKEQSILELETDKATAEVPSDAAGVVKEVKVKSGDSVKVGQILIVLDAAENGGDAAENGGAAASSGKEEAEPEPEPEPERDEAPPVQEKKEAKEEPEKKEPRAEREKKEAGEEPEKPPTAEGRDEEERLPSDGSGRPQQPSLGIVRGKESATSAPSAPASIGSVAPASPSVRRLARELGLDVERVRGTGPGGRISEDDVKAFAREMIARAGRAAGPSVLPASGREIPELPDFTRWGEVEREPLGKVRRVTGESMSTSWSLIPHVTQFDRADITDLETWRRRYASKAEARGGKLTLTAIVVKVAAAALKVFPRFNASLDDRAGELVLKKFVNVGVAVDTDHGLLVPVIKNADRKNLVELAVELNALAEKARDRKASLEDLSGANLNVSNLGGLGTTYFSPIVAWPQVAVIGVGRANREPVYRDDGSWDPRLILPLAVSYDHRAVDGADAARFLRWVAEALEQPLLLALEG